MPSPPRLEELVEPYDKIPLPRSGSREAVGFALAWLDEDDALADEILAGHSFSGPQLQFVASLAALVNFARVDDDAWAECLYEIALTQASQ